MGQIRKLKKKGNIVMRKVWGLGERTFKDDFRRRMMLFRYLVMGVIMYGAEIWGWRERGELQVIQKKYVKWSLGLDSCTPDYIIYKESGIDKIRITAGYRAVKFEEEALKEGNRRLLIECIKAKERKKGSKEWMGERERGFLQTNGFSTEGIKDLREREEDVKDIIRRNARNRMGQWLEQKMRESRYNDRKLRYKNSASIGMPDYLLKRGEGGSPNQKMIARWRCGNEEERKGFWKTEEEKKCRIYGVEEGCIEHMSHTTRIKIEVDKVLDERGKRQVVKWMREIHRRGIESVVERNCKQSTLAVGLRAIQ